jgi:hypothetical protein
MQRRGKYAPSIIEAVFSAWSVQGSYLEESNFETPTYLEMSLVENEMN